MRLMNKGKEALECVVRKSPGKFSRVMIGEEGPELTVELGFRNVFEALHLGIAIEEP